MFGYVRPDKAELKIKDYETYKAVYCTLCKTLGKQYGLFSRFFLTFDSTFYIFILKSLLQDKADCVHKGVCRFNPLKKCNYIDEDYIFKKAAGLTIIMTYYKIKDDIKDNKLLKRFISYLIYPYIKIKYKKAAEKYPELNEIIKNSMAEQLKIEQSNNECMDLACEPTAKSLSQIFSLDIEDENKKIVIERVCYCLGRWVYLMDAFDDFEDDFKSGSFNPFVNKFKINNGILDKRTLDEIIKSIRLTANETALAFDLLDKNCYRDVLENIIFDGMENELKKIVIKKEKRVETLNE